MFQCKIMDGSKEQTFGKFCQKLQESAMERRPQNLNLLGSIEQEIMKFKKEAGQNLFLTNTQRQIWDSYLDYKAYICSHTVHNIFKLEGEVPETVMSSMTANNLVSTNV